jgi:transporter family protein
MDWLLFAFIPPMFWAICNVIDKFLLEKYIKDPISYQILISFFDAVSLIIILFLSPISGNAYVFLLGIMIGILGLVATTLYNKSMLDEEASRVVPLVYLDSIFVVILAYIFLGEVFNLQKYLGIILVIAGGILISLKKIVRKWHFSPTIKFILIAGFLWAISSVISKYTLNFTDYFSLTAFQMLGYIVFGPLFLFSNRARMNFLSCIKRFDRKVFLLMIIVTLIYLVGVLSFYFAVSISSISLVYAIASTQPFFIFAYMLIITKIAPSIVKEEIDKSTVLLKIIAICLIFLGTFFIGS